MVSDHEIVSEVLDAMARVNRGECSVQTAGADALRNLYARAKGIDLSPGVAHVFRPIHQDDGA